MKKLPPFVIYAPEYNENIGGHVALHLLCDLINKAGREAYIYPRPERYVGSSRVKKYLFITRKMFKKTFYRDFATFPGFHTPLLGNRSIGDAIVVYPETTSGNPLGGRNVVRWLMHKAGYHTGTIEFAPSDLIFYFQAAFDSAELQFPKGGQLQVLHIRDDIYRKVNFDERKGSCYILRKGKGRELVHDVSDSILIDGLSHEQAAKVFNQVEMCISYDPYTLYSQYAAICGCVSVVVPKEGVTEQEWQPDTNLRLGVAYGFDRVGWARKTQHRVLECMRNLVNASNDSVAEFIRKCDQHFGN